MMAPTLSKLSHTLLDYEVGVRMRTANRMFIANYTYQDVKKYYDDSVQESVYCRGVRYAREAGKTKVILKICDLHMDDAVPVSDDRVTISEFKTEVEYATKASAIGLGPLVYMSAIMPPGVGERGPTFGVIAMYKFDDKESLHNITSAFERDRRHHNGKHEIAVRCGDCRDIYDIDRKMGMAYQRALALMWEVGKFMHMDLHQGNIFYHDQQIYFIDYGLVLSRANIELASPKQPLLWNPRQLGSPIEITGLESAYDTSAYDVISYMESVLSRYISSDVVELFLKPRVELWSELMYRIV